MVQCQVSVERINKFMNADELDPDSVTHKENFEDPIVVENADFTWNVNVSHILDVVQWLLKMSVFVQASS